jgi:hypothetical protein
MADLPEQDEAERRASAPRRRRWYRRRDVRFLLFAVTAVLLFHGYGYLTGPSRLTERLAARLAADPERVNIVVTTKFPPEAFHIGIYQEVGRIAGTDGNSVLLYQVRPADVLRLSRKYWVAEIDAAAESIRN